MDVLKNKIYLAPDILFSLWSVEFISSVFIYLLTTRNTFHLPSLQIIIALLLTTPNNSKEYKVQNRDLSEFISQQRKTSRPTYFPALDPYFLHFPAKYIHVYIEPTRIPCCCWFGGTFFLAAASFHFSITRSFISVAHRVQNIELYNESIRLTYEVVL